MYRVVPEQVGLSSGRLSRMESIMQRLIPRSRPLHEASPARHPNERHCRITETHESAPNPFRRPAVWQAD